VLTALLQVFFAAPQQACVTRSVVAAQALDVSLLRPADVTYWARTISIKVPKQ
jgi:hypothetical protein